jgi:hypothetical protein
MKSFMSTGLNACALRPSREGGKAGRREGGKAENEGPESFLRRKKSRAAGPGSFRREVKEGGGSYEVNLIYGAQRGGVEVRVGGSTDRLIFQ